MDDFSYDPPGSLSQLRGRDLQLRTQIGEAQKAKAAIGETVLKEKRALTDFERHQVTEALPERIAAIEKQLADNSEKLLAIESPRPGQVAASDADGAASQAAYARAGFRTDIPMSAATTTTTPTGRTYAEMFGHASMSADGWASPDEFLATLHSPRSDSRLHSSFMPPQMHATAVGTTGADGGYSVPTQYTAEWLDASLESEIVRPRAKIWPMNSDTWRVPGWDASDSSSTLYGAFSAQWVTQGSEISEETPKLRAITLTARKLALLTQVANELISDGLGYNEQLGRAIVSAIGWYLDEAFLVGPGAPGPQGVIGSTAARSPSHVAWPTVLSMTT